MHKPHQRLSHALCLAAALAALPAIGHAQSPPPSSPAPAPPSGQTLAQQFQALHWLVGPTTVTVGDKASFSVPDGYAMLAPPDSVKYLQLNQNPTSESDNNDYILQPIHHHGDWFAVLFYEDTGHIADDQSIDAGQLLDQVKSNSAADNEERQKLGMPSLTLSGWALQPSYDHNTHRLQWAFDFNSADGTQTVNLNTRILSRTGDMKVILVDDPAALQADLPGFNTALAGFSFNAGQRYADYHTGDKLAQYGLAGLIAGGAAAVAVKTGLFATILGALAASAKAIIVGIGVLMAALRNTVRKLFRKS